MLSRLEHGRSLPTPSLSPRGQRQSAGRPLERLQNYYSIDLYVPALLARPKAHYSVGTIVHTPRNSPWSRVLTSRGYAACYSRRRYNLASVSRYSFQNSKTSDTARPPPRRCPTRIASDGRRYDALRFAPQDV